MALGEDGSLFFKAKTGERAPFDPPRKIRAELSGVKTFGKGQVISLKGTFKIDPSTAMADAEWLSLFQIHAADVRFANGVPISAGPMFTIDMVPGSGGRMLRVRAETSNGLPAPNTFVPLKVLATFPITLGVNHTFDITVVDGHGDDGSVKVVIDGKTVCDYSGQTGYEFVELAPPLNGRPQPKGSYWKIGIYAGRGSGDMAPATSAALAVKLMP